MANPQRHERVVNELVKQIYLGKLKPETKLPTEKQLSAQMKVDRTSLRLGLKQLESMKVLSIRQGDGIYVKDYLKNAGLDFLGLTFQQLETDSNQMAIDNYIMDEIWEFWIMFFPPVLELAIRRGSTRDLKSMAELISAQEKCIRTGDREKIVEFGIGIQDKIAEIVNNTIVLLFFNSCRPLRKKIMEMLIYSLDEKGLKGVVNSEKALLQLAIKGSETEIAQASKMLRENYEAYRQRLRELMGDSLKTEKTAARKAG
jgi:GntR family transcriptional regulator, transcriptional repressor for pyruvate dehydrogenase complex